MAKVLAFPTKKVLSEKAMDDLYQLAKQHVKLLNNVVDEVAGPDPTEAEMNEVMELVLLAFIEAVNKVISES